MTKSDEKAYLEAYTPGWVDQVQFSQDPVIFTLIDDRLHVLLIKRADHPFKGQWSLPGGRVDQKACRTLEEALAKKLKEKTGVTNIYFEQVCTEGAADMDPRGWSVTTVYMALVPFDQVDLSGAGEQGDVAWHPVDDLTELGELAFWHTRLIGKALERLRDKLIYKDMAMPLMPKRFTIKQLRTAYEALLSRALSRPAFDKRIKNAGILTEVGMETDVSYRPAVLYEYKNKNRMHSFSRELKTD